MPGNERLARGVLELLVDAAGFERGLDGAGRKTKSFEKQVGDIGKGLLPLTGLLAAAGGASIKFATDLNAGMANIATLIPGNTARVRELKTEVQDLAVETGKSTGDLTDGLYNVVSAFGDTADTAKILEINAKGAAGGLATTADAIDLTSAVTKAYGDTSAAAVQQASDLALTTVRLGQTTFPELAASIGRVTPLTSELKVSQEELFAVMATGTGVTGGAAEVSTQLRGVLQSMMAPTADMAALFEHLGVESGEALIQQEGLQGAMGLVVEAAKASGQPLQKFISSIEGQTLALALTGSQADAYNEKLGAMGQATGATDTAFREQTEGINEAGFAWEQMKQAVIVNAQKLGGELLPRIMDTAKELKPLAVEAKALLDWFLQLPEPVKTTGFLLAGVATAAGPTLIVFSKLIAASRMVTTAFAAQSVATTGVSAASLTAAGSLRLLGAAGAVLGTAVAAWELGKVIRDLGGVAVGTDTAGHLVETLGVKALTAGEYVEFLAVRLSNWSLSTDDILLSIISRRDDLAAVGEQAAETGEQFDAAAEAARIQGEIAAVQAQAERELEAALAGATAGLEGFTGATTRSSEASERQKETVDEQLEALRSLGLVTGGDVADRLTQFAALEKRATDEGIDMRAFLEAVVPDLQDFARQAAASGAPVDGLRETIARLNGELDRLRGTPPIALPVTFDASPIVTAFDAVDISQTKTRLDAEQLAGAYDTLGITSQASLNQTAAAAQAAYETMLRSGTATEAELEAARLRVLETERAAAGETVSIWQDQIGPMVLGTFEDMLTGAVSWKEGLRSLLDQTLSFFVNTFVGGLVQSFTGGLSKMASGAGGFFSSLFGGGGGAGAGGAMGFGASLLSGLGSMGVGLAVQGVTSLITSRINTTKGSREEFAQQFGGMDALFDQLNRASERSGGKDTRGWDLVDQALNVIGRKDSSANQQWMQNVLAVLDESAQAADQTADAFGGIGGASAEAASETETAFGGVAGVVREIGAGASDTEGQIDDLTRSLSHKMADLFGHEDVAGQADAIRNLVRDMVGDLQSEISAADLRMPVSVEFDDIVPPGLPPGARTEPIPRFANRPLERVTGAGLAMLDPGDVVGFPPEGLGQRRPINLTWNIKAWDSVDVYRQVRGPMKHEFIEMLLDDPDTRREIVRALRVTGG